jgi:hypothetical protein
MTFREFMQIDEQPNVLFDKPVKIVVDIDGRPQEFTVDIIDVRAEDWTQTQVRTADGIFMSKAPKTLSGFQPFSLPLANGQFINHDAWSGNTISPEPLKTIARKDWAKFAQFVLGNKVVKGPLVQRNNDAKVG